MSQKKYIVEVSVVVVRVAVVAVTVTDVCVLLADVLVVDMLDTVEEVLVCDVNVPVKDVLVKLLVTVMLVDEIVRLVKVPVEVVVEGHPLCSLSQHHSFFASDQLNSQLL